jgi:hypothetical protein
MQDESSFDHFPAAISAMATFTLQKLTRDAAVHCPMIDFLSRKSLLVNIVPNL